VERARRDSNGITIPGGIWLASFGAFFVAIFLAVNPRRAALLGIVYALLQGFCLGAISAARPTRHRRHFPAEVSTWMWPRHVVHAVVVEGRSVRKGAFVEERNLLVRALSELLAAE
jgi:hypothetical protein